MIPTSDTLKRASEIIQQVEALQAELVSLFGGAATSTAPKRRGRPPGSTSGKAAPDSAAPAPSRGKRKMSPEGRARIAAAAKARWVKFHAAQKKANKA